MEVQPRSGPRCSTDHRGPRRGTHGLTRSIGATALRCAVLDGHRRNLRQTAAYRRHRTSGMRGTDTLKKGGPCFAHKRDRVRVALRTKNRSLLPCRFPRPLPLIAEQRQGRRRRAAGGRGGVPQAVHGGAARGPGEGRAQHDSAARPGQRDHNVCCYGSLTIPLRTCKNEPSVLLRRKLTFDSLLVSRHA